MKLFFLSTQNILTKKFTRLPSGEIQKTSYLNAYEVTSHQEDVTNLAQFLDTVKAHAEAGHCLVKGELTRPLVSESRAGSTDSNAHSEWVCLDFDGLPPEYPIDDILKMMGLGDTSYILQWSASQGITSTDLRCHVFMMLAKPASAPLLKQWLIQLNHQTPFLRDNMALTKTHMALTWGLDVSACQSDKLIYIAPPILEGIRSPLGRKPRYELVTKVSTHLVLPLQINTPVTNQLLTAARVADLRAGASLPARKNNFKTYKDTEVLSKPDEAMVTEIRQDRGFVYFNLNGGDSWAYYHPEDNPEIIYNFKGEPNYATKELLPDYYKQAKARVSKEASAEAGVGAYIRGPQQPVLLAFRERTEGSYHHGSYAPLEDHLDLTIAKSEKQIRDFCMQFNMPIGDYVPIWDQVFEPQSNFRVDVENRVVNLFAPTQYMHNVCTPKVAPKHCPPTIKRLVNNFLADDSEAIEHFFNWLAFIVQKRERPQTAWVLYGTEGTGKGTFCSKVLRPLLGLGQTAMVPGYLMSEIFNGYLKDKLLVIFDEAHVAQMKDADVVLGKLRNWITEPTVTIRKMHSNGLEVTNYAAFMLLSNQPDVIQLQKKDRRWNIGPWQDQKLDFTDHERDVLLVEETQAFYNYLAHYPLDEKRARTPLVSESRDRLINTTTNAADDVADALRGRFANLGFFLDQLPSDGSSVAHRASSSVLEYKKVVRQLIERTRLEATGRCKISRDELQTLFEYTVGSVPITPNKFTKFLAHRHLHTEKVRIGDLTPYGIQVAWKDYALFEDYYRALMGAPEPEKNAPNKKAKK